MEVANKRPKTDRRGQFLNNYLRVDPEGAAHAKPNCYATLLEALEENARRRQLEGGDTCSTTCCGILMPTEESRRLCKPEGYDSPCGIRSCRPCLAANSSVAPGLKLCGDCLFPVPIQTKTCPQCKRNLIKRRKTEHEEMISLGPGKYHEKRREIVKKIKELGQLVEEFGEICPTAFASVQLNLPGKEYGEPEERKGEALTASKPLHESYIFGDCAHILGSHLFHSASHRVYSCGVNPDAQASVSLDQLYGIFLPYFESLVTNDDQRHVQQRLQTQSKRSRCTKCQAVGHFRQGGQTDMLSTSTLLPQQPNASLQGQGFVQPTATDLFMLSLLASTRQPQMTYMLNPQNSMQTALQTPLQHPLHNPLQTNHVMQDNNPQIP